MLVTSDVTLSHHIEARSEEDVPSIRVRKIKQAYTRSVSILKPNLDNTELSLWTCGQTIDDRSLTRSLFETNLSENTNQKPFQKQWNISLQDFEAHTSPVDVGRVIPTREHMLTHDKEHACHNPRPQRVVHVPEITDAAGISEPNVAAQ